MMYVVMILAAFVGIWLADASAEALGLVGGAIIAFLWFKLSEVQRRVQELERDVQHDIPIEAPSPEPAVVKTSTRIEREVVAPLSTSADLAEPDSTPQSVKIADVADVQIGGIQNYGPSEPATPSTAEKLLARAKGWLTTGNVPVKLGVVVSFFGIAFLLRYAVDNQVVVVPVEVRYLLIAIAALAMLVVGWRLRERSSVYALSLQGGGIGILYLTLFAAFRLHPLLPPLLAFGLLVLLTLFTGLLAVLQNAQALAVLGVVGGFAAPVLVSTGSGNHVALFSYYLLLNCAVLGIAWYKSWRILNVLGFLFTFGVGTAWGYRSYRPELFDTTEPFLIVFFLFYQAIAILFAFRQPPNLRGFVDGTLIFGTPVVAFALQSQLLKHSEFGLALSAVAVAVFYLVTATWIYRSQGRSMRLLAESFLALGIAFATIAVPLALDSQWTAAAWALEGAALVWVGVRQHGLLAKLSGSALVFAAGVAFFEDGWDWNADMPFINGNLLGGMLIAGASLFASRYLAADTRPSRLQNLLAVPLLLWGLFWWIGTGTIQLFGQFSDEVALNGLTLFIAVSVSLLAWIARRYDWLAARRATLAFVPLLPVLALAYLFEHDHLFTGFGVVAWLAAIAAHFGLLWAYDNGRGRVEGLWHFVGGGLITGLVAHEIAWRTGQAGLSDTWSVSAGLLLPLIVAAVILFQRRRIAWPLQRYTVAYFSLAAVLIAGQLLAMASAGISEPGDPAPLPYIPLLNPFDLLSAFGLLLALKLVNSLPNIVNDFDQTRLRWARTAFGAVAFVLSTIAVVRATHHLADIDWRQHALLDSVQVQSALSIYWAALGFGGMVLGARLSRRWIWVAGAALMVVVVLKLFFVDFGNTGTVARIVSFIGVGALLVVVGYFAPAPPKQPIETPEEDSLNGVTK